MAEWFRSKHGAPFDPKWGLIARRAKTSRAVVVSVAWCLMDIASQATSRGDVSGADPEELAVALDIDEADVMAVIEAMKSKDCFIDKSGKIASWDRHQPKWEGETSTKRVQEFRNRNKNNKVDGETVKRVSSVSETESETDETSETVKHCRTEKNREESIFPTPLPVSAPAGPDDRIDQIRKAVWRQHGLTEDQIATKLASASTEGLKQARSWLEAGLTVEDILDAVSRAYDDAKDPIRKPWVYLDAAMHTAIERKEAPEPEASHIDQNAARWRARLDGWVQRKLWGPMFGPRPDDPAFFEQTECPRTILGEYFDVGEA